MRIVQLIPALTVGGAERIVSLLALAQQAAGHEVSVVALGKPSGSWIERELQQQGVETVFLGKGPGFDARAVPRLARWLRSARPDVIHTHLHVLKYLLPTRLAYRPPVIVHTLHNLAAEEAAKPDQALQMLAFRWRVAPVAIGDAVARSTTELYGLEPAAVIPNGVPVAAFQAPEGTRARIRGELGIPENAPVLLSVGRLNPQKNHALLFEAFAQAELAAAGAWLLLAGKGELQEELEAQARELGIDAQVRFLGVRRDVPDLLAAADLFVLASRYEGNPLVVMEAMAAGRAVVATAVGCVPELVGPETGRLVPPGDAGALGGALAELAGDLACAHALGEAAVRTARDRFDVSVMAAHYLALYARRAA